MWPVEEFFKLHSRTTEGEKDKKWTQKGNFLANEKSLSEFIVTLLPLGAIFLYFAHFR